MTALRRILTGALLALLAGQALAESRCAPDQVSLRTPGGEVRFQVDLAQTPEERARGLMHVPQMAAGQGMLFVYEHPQSVAFWMKNTLIPLDMIFAGADGVVRKVHARAVPGDLTPIRGGDDILVVLEINGGLAAMLGIVPGSVMQHPVLGPEAAWPCPPAP